MIVTVRRWTSIALPRLRAGSKEKSKVSETRRPEKQDGFLETYSKMFEHQVNLMFKDDLAE